MRITWWLQENLTKILVTVNTSITSISTYFTNLCALIAALHYFLIVKRYPLLLSFTSLFFFSYFNDDPILYSLLRRESFFIFSRYNPFSFFASMLLFFFLILFFSINHCYYYYFMFIVVPRFRFMALLSYTPENLTNANQCLSE